jgi:hypothetical protein
MPARVRHRREGDTQTEELRQDSKSGAAYDPLLAAGDIEDMLSVSRLAEAAIAHPMLDLVS